MKRPRSSDDAQVSFVPLTSSEGYRFDDLPPGWVKQFDPNAKRYFYVDTAIPRSTWSHPYNDDEYIRQHGGRKFSRRSSGVHTGMISPIVVNTPKRQLKDDGFATSMVMDLPQPVVRDPINNDLEFLLNRDFSFEGKYCMAASNSSVPNPGLEIRGIGMIGLPLTDRDTKLIQNIVMSSSRSGPPIGNVWELDSAVVSCENPAWTRYLEDVVLMETWQTLSPCSNRPRLKLKRLLLWEASADILEYECTENSTGALGDFASIHMILPSVYSGAQLEFRYSGCRENYDLSSASDYSTSRVAWYHGMECIIKPITSGRRLALSYHLIHSVDGPPPSLPSMQEKILDLRRLLRKWANMKDAGSPAPSIIAYLLKHDYRDKKVLGGGILKAEDRHKVLHLQALCEELGFQLGLGILEDHQIGDASQQGGEKSPQISTAKDRRLAIQEVFSFEGFVLPDMVNLRLEEQDIIPALREDAFPDVIKEDKDTGITQFWYRRTVLVIIHKKSMLDVLLQTKQVPYALGRLREADPRLPTAEDRKIAAYVMKSLSTTRPFDFEAQRVLAEISLSWKDHDLWTRVAQSSGPEGSLISTLNAIQWLPAWKQFSFAGVSESLQYCWDQKGVANCLDFFLKVDDDSIISSESGSNREIVVRWSTDQLQRVLRSTVTLGKNDVPLYIRLVRQKGMTFFSHMILRFLTRVPSAHSFWVEFTRSLYLLKPTGNDRDRDISGDAGVKLFDALVEQCLDIIVQDLHTIFHSGNFSMRLQCVVEAIDLCLTTGRLDLCSRVLSTSIPREASSAQLADIYNPPYVSPLRQTLQRHGFDVFHPPFDDFFRILIGCYLHHVLGLYSRPGIRRICGSCPTCQVLDDFILSPNLVEAHFVGGSTETNHIQTHLTAGVDVVSYYYASTHGTGKTLIVKRHDDREDDSSWHARRERASQFLTTIGNMSTVEKLMGRRYSDVLSALEGKIHFPIRVEDTPLSPVSPGPPTQPSQHSLPPKAGNNRKCIVHHYSQGKWVVAWSENLT